MKKLLLATVLLYMSLLSCQKETSTLKQNSTSGEQSLSRSNANSYDHVVRNMGYNRGFMSPHGNYNMANVTISFESTFPNLWYLEKFGNNYAKFWSQRRGTFDKWRVLDIDWRNPQSDMSTNVAIWTTNGDLNQEWELIGYNNTGALDSRNGFVGFIVNRYNGQMLEARTLIDNYSVNVVTAKQYKGSEEQKAYEKDGNFGSVAIKDL
ncbi:MAG: RICIN domain-containing protein [Solitalea-like symbiont of Acarus siro]